MIIALPSIAAERCTRLPSAHALGTKALWPGGDARQAILFFEPHYALAPASKSSAILPGADSPAKSRSKSRPESQWLVSSFAGAYHCRVSQLSPAYMR